MKLEPRNKQVLSLVEAKAYVDLSDWDNGEMRNRNMVRMEGMVAEKRKYWKTTFICYSDESRMYSDDEKSLRKRCIARQCHEEA